uniref:NADH-ubiquinone oxidoreductase chain 4 n=1 Tax=Lepidopsocidae sp. RS-2001 TaxID=159971 RepID=Q7YHL8_9NEOP|nr:NADH dehydrogenase subunit 4 [Lepidopsocidae sp. RS-2001]AAP44720.1 NADH dehydrogenase subunit 4 [Lepidopsocidae sp. RS-2001]
MLKFLIMFMSLIPLIFYLNWWLISYMMFFMTFIFMFFFSDGFFHYFMSFDYGMDILSYGLIILSIWISTLMLISSKSVFRLNFFKSLFMLNILILMIILMLTFSTLSFFMFYLFFESSLLPTLLLIIGWGYQPERLQAGIYMLMYTLTASLPLLMGLFYLNDLYGSLNFYLINMLSNLNYLLYFSLILAFMVKLPVVFIHLWLPKAHVEAPVSGSMILAGVLLKLGGYGLLRIYKILLLKNFFSIYFIMISLIGVMFMSIMCIRQTDLKSLIAYSSVVHMGLMFSGFLTGYCWSVNGSFLLMIAHGLCSSGLFALSNMSYERLGSRSLIINRGLYFFMPTMSLWWFLFSIFNGAAPPSLNLWAEICMLTSLICWSMLTIFFLIVISFFSVCYSLYLYSFSNHGKFYLGSNNLNSGFISEYMLLMIHLVPLLMFTLNLDCFMIWI